MFKLLNNELNETVKFMVFNLKDYQDYMKNYTRLYGLTPDQLVAQFVSKYI